MKTVDLRANAILSRLLFKNPVGAEVGVFRGTLSSRLLARRDLRLYMVDNWRSAETQPQHYRDSEDYHTSLTKEQQEDCYCMAKYIAQLSRSRAKVIRKDSVAAAGDFEDQSLDFVFIDADHSYEGCKADIEAWAPKIKPGGLLCGHDIQDRFPGVDKAVYEYAARHHYRVELDVDQTWFIRLPGEMPEMDESLRDVHILNIVCVKWGDKYGPEYVNILLDMVARNCDRPFRFICFTDNTEWLHERVEVQPLPKDLPGWWNKIYLFKPGLFKGRVLYLDLDVCITGPVEPLIDQKAICSDWHLPTYNSSVMCWDAGEHKDIYEKFREKTMERLHGDQDWITELGGWETYPNSLCVSYRKHAVNWIPDGSSVVCFHGDPKPHEVKEGWVPLVWKIHGLTPTRFIQGLNTDESVMLSQIKENLKRDIPMFMQCPPHDLEALIVGGGASINDLSVLANLRLRYQRGGNVFALNNTHDWLYQHGFTPDFHVMLDARKENIQFIQHPNKNVTYLIAAQCHPSIFDQLDGFDVIQWVGWVPGIQEAIQGTDKPVIAVGGGNTVGLRTLSLAYLMGYRKLHLYGFDSCHRNGKSHAYDQSLNDKQALLEVTCAGRTFTCSRSMAKQAQDIQPLINKLTAAGCDITIHGEGLIPWIVEVSQKETLVIPDTSHQEVSCHTKTMPTLLH